jgi:dTDP-4-amino-4,6-dideoxygalactose transaminase
MTPLFKVFMPPGIDAAMARTLHSGFLAEGAKVKEFTAQLAAYLGNPHVVPVSSCTMALTVALRCAGVGPGDEVISTPLTCIATNLPILQLGAKIVWADCDPADGMTDPAQVEALITPRTKALIILHKEGDPARLDAFLEITRCHGLKLIEDAAHAFGTRYRGVRIGNHGDYVCFSFQAIKHITTGDGGALVCRDPEDVHAARRFKWFGVEREARTGGNTWDLDVTHDGYKGNLNDLAATLGVEQMKHVDEVIGGFHRNGKRYETALQGIPGLTQIRRDPRDASTYWGYCVLVENRAGFIAKLREHGVDARQIHPRNDTLSVFAPFRRPLPGIDFFDPREVCLPCGWWVSPEEVERIAHVVRSGW